MGFFVSLVFCWALQWTSDELVWSFWIASLTTGFFTILVGFFFKVFRLSSDGGKLSFNALHLFVSALLYLPALVFFCLHFGGFHLAHSVALNEFFPVAGFFGGIPSPPNPKKIPIDDVIKYFPNLLFEFWPIIVATGITRWHGVKKAVSREDTQFRELMILPYGLVVQIHLSIFLIGFLQMFKVDPTITTLGVMIFYYFPFSVFLKRYSTIAQRLLGDQGRSTR